MTFIIGLGNSGKEYERTRHNVGFLVVEAIAKSLGATWQRKADFEAEVAEGQRGTEKVLLAKPTTMMNDSGRAVAKIMRYYRLVPEDVIVAHDDVDLPFGEIRVEAGRGSAGHRGVESVIKALDTQEFLRLRFGVRNELYQPGTKTADDFVLTNFTADEVKQLPELIQKVIAAIEQMLDGG